MKYKGRELIEYKANIGAIFDPPKAAMVWDDGGENNPNCTLVYAYTPKSEYPVVCDEVKYRHVAFIPDELLNEKKPRFATRRELARWLAQGNGQRTATNYSDVYSDMWVYPKNFDNKPVDKDVLVRKWDDEEWHEATIDYLGIKEG